MIFKHNSDLINGPVRPATIIFLTQGPDSLKDRPELASFRLTIQQLLANGSFKGKYLETLPLYFPEHENWLILVGLGEYDKLSANRVLEAGATATQTLTELALREAFIAAPILAKLTPTQVMELVVQGSRLGAETRYNFKTKTDQPTNTLRTLTFWNADHLASIARPKTVITRAQIAAEAQIQARRLADLPANHLDPVTLADMAVNVANRQKLQVTVWDEGKIEAEGAGGLLAVGQGSSRPPRMVILEYPGTTRGSKTVVLVGKGITFDSGGLCLKPAENMSQMKTDMSGAAVVLATMEAVPSLKIPHKVIGIMPLAENMPSQKAYRPGDVITTLSGQTVEIVNTDAEGRLILADALTLGQRYQPDCLIDIATLTGACLVALGERCAGLFSDSEYLRNGLLRAGQLVGETYWPMPLLNEYEEDLRSELADFKQASNRNGGAIMAALFLRRFVKPSVPWAHLDIAGTARKNRKSPSGPEGGSGFGVPTLLKFLCSI
ncbi:MAG: leucyl aminopeptidase [Deltaproteobacteria bacterium]|jgi:leucyl aminopeptidase|nr:leucyl aminopeptidase [Deltaproteobacteria bacterium]